MRIEFPKISCLEGLCNFVSTCWHGSKVDHLARPLLASLSPPSTLPPLSKAITPPPSRCAWIYQLFFNTTSTPLALQGPCQRALRDTPPFKGYCNLQGVALLSVLKRPANFLFEAFFAASPHAVTQPASGKLFAWTTPQAEVAQFIEEKARLSPHEVVSFSANNADFGSNTYEITRQEVADLIHSQRIYTSRLLPLPFYMGLKQAMEKEGIVILPGSDLRPKLLKDVFPRFISQVAKNPTQYGFKDGDHFETFRSLSLYQIGAMVVKTQHCHLLADGNCQIFARRAGTPDVINLIDLCGIRGLGSSDPRPNFSIMKETFKTALIAAQGGVLLVPAVGMGVWGGDPDLYWRALIEAVLESEVPLDYIGVNPGHQKTSYGKYKGCSGEEFATILREYATTPALKAKLEKIDNLHLRKKDIVQLARNLKLAYPGKTVSLVNASDPDVTLGFHVGEYTNTLQRGTTTEENYAALCTNGFCFEGITKVLQDPKRCLQT